VEWGGVGWGRARARATMLQMLQMFQPCSCSKHRSSLVPATMSDALARAAATMAVLGACGVCGRPRSEALASIYSDGVADQCDSCWDDEVEQADPAYLDALVEDSNHPSGDAGALDEYAKGMVKGKFFGFKIAGSGKGAGAGGVVAGAGAIEDGKKVAKNYQEAVLQRGDKGYKEARQKILDGLRAQGSPAMQGMIEQVMENDNKEDDKKDDKNDEKWMHRF